MSEHKRFTVEQGCRAAMSDWFICHTPKPVYHDDGSFSFGISFPAIAATTWLGDPEKTLNGIADALNEDDSKDALIAELVDACKQAAVLHEDDEGIAQVLLAAIAKVEGK